jgi:hypothetical protein
MMTGMGTGPILPWPHQAKEGSKPEIGPPGREQERRAAKRRHAAERHHEGRHFQPGDREALQIAAGEADRNGRERGKPPAVADPAFPHGEPILQAPLGDGPGDQSGEGEQRADREVDAGGQDDEGHADREQAGDRHLPHHVEEIDRREEARLDHGEERHQRDEEQRRGEPGDEAKDVEASPLARVSKPRFSDDAPH